MSLFGGFHKRFPSGDRPLVPPAWGFYNLDRVFSPGMLGLCSVVGVSGTSVVFFLRGCTVGVPWLRFVSFR